MLFNTDIDTMSDAQKAQIQNEHTGFIFQEFYLDEDIPAIENIMLPYYITSKKDYKEKKKRFIKNLHCSVLREKKLSSELSTGKNANWLLLEQL